MDTNTSKLSREEDDIRQRQIDEQLRIRNLSVIAGNNAAAAALGTAASARPEPRLRA